MTGDSYQTIRTEREGPILRLFLNRPDVHNALDDVTFRELRDVFEDLVDDHTTRVVIVTGEGRSFSAGADLNWMRRVAEQDRAQNLEDARALAETFHIINGSAKAVVARVNGAAMGGACGLISCCDIAVCVDDAKMAFSEVKLGIVPATISPFVFAKIGTSAARRYLLSGERFTPDQAMRMGLVHEVVSASDLDSTVDRVVRELLSAGPAAVAHTKELVRELALRRLPEVNEYTARLIATVRATDEAKEGMRAFLEKRKPAWREGE